MANKITPTDVYSSFNTLIGQQAGGALATSYLGETITVGQAAQLYGYENTLNALSIAMGRVLIGVRPYTGSFALIESDNEAYGQIARKISYFYDGFEGAKDWETGTGDGAHLKDGQSVDMYKIHKRYPLEMQFGGLKVLEKSYTRFLRQLKVAFSNAEQFDAFYRGEAVQINNEIQMMKEAENRALVLNAIGATFNTGNANMKVNLTKLYNEETGTSLTTAELLSGTFLPVFVKFFVSKIKFFSDLMQKNTSLYHLTPVKTGDGGENLVLYRHTPKDAQRLIIPSKLWYDVETNVMSSIFNDGYLKLDQAERIAYWQSPADPMKVNVTPNQFDVSTGLSKDGDNVSDLVVVGLLYDKNALAVTYRQEDVLTTPVNASGVYYNTVHHWAKDYRYDPTENMILFYMKDEV